MEKKKGITAGHLTMLALGTVIGGSFFLGSSVAINAAGPSIIIAYVFGGVLVYYILYAMSEMTVANPDYGGFRTYATKAFGERTGFVVGWIYWVGMALGMSSEATAASILLRQWFPNISLALMGTAIIAGVTLINLLGAVRLSRLESGLAGIKVFTVAGFILIAVSLVVGLFGGRPAVGLGEVAREAFAPGGLGGLLGSMLIVMFSYCGFEIIALAASEVKDPGVTIPRAIRYTVLSLVSLFILYIAFLLPLVPTAELNENTSAIAASLTRYGIGWVGTVISVVVVSAILSTMLATMFGLGRMMRSLADEGQAPRWLKEKTDVPYRGILASGVGMLAALGFGLLLPRVYLFLLSSGGFAILFTYAVMMASHLRLRKKYGCPPEGKCQMRGYPYTSGFVLVSLIVAIVSMPFVKGQGAGLVAGLVLVVFFEAAFSFLKYYRRRHRGDAIIRPLRNAGLAPEFSKELTDTDKRDTEDKGKEE
ncbi:L-asparagine transporter [Sporobacter termitidis DSM 10068]|uniref:L-asparagine transporter n=1 Tax=Sporobacter termitidis DSM 10068 TaxID=1123282 RepID=A0A1M5YVV6_9FIRM|nr:amino acid permease [Sporobacter termitidis]SHI16105.1 L-asparagine transporter [Sporobacter termitidis DSM 10068]